MALAWVLSKGEDIRPIPGTKRRTYLEQTADATFLPLASEVLTRLDELAADVVGDRYPDMRTVER